jgi:hypothetical protein
MGREAWEGTALHELPVSVFIRVHPWSAFLGLQPRAWAGSGGEPRMNTEGHGWLGEEDYDPVHFTDRLQRLSKRSHGRPPMEKPHRNPEAPAAHG